MLCPYCGRGGLGEEEITRQWEMGSGKGGPTWIFKQWRCKKCKKSFRTQERIDIDARA